MFSAPAVPLPSPLYLKQRKSRTSTHWQRQHELLSSNDVYSLKESNAALRGALHDAAAEHGADSGAPAWERSSFGHLQMAARHVLAAIGCGAAMRHSASSSDKELSCTSPRSPLGGRPSSPSLGARTSRSELSESGKLTDNGGEMLPTGVIMPTSKWKENWDLYVLALIIYSGVMVPYRVCYNAAALGFMWGFEFSMTCAFLVDMCFTFNTAIVAENGAWITDKSVIASKYLKGWFWIDAPSSLPVELMDLFVSEGNLDSLHMLRFLRMFRLLRLLKLLKIDKYLELLEDALPDGGMRVVVGMRILVMVIKLVFLAHLLGCFWFYTAFLVGEADPDIDTWIRVYADGDAAEGPPEKQYLYSFYWALTTLTTVGYGDITPQNDTERSYCIMALLIGGLVFGYMLSQIGGLVSALDRDGVVAEEKMDAVKGYISWRQIPRELALRIKKFYQAQFRDGQGTFDEVQMLGGLAPSLRAELSRFLVSQTLGKVSVFDRKMSKEMQTEIFPLLKPVQYAQGEVFFRKGEPAKELFFLVSGEIDILDPGGHVITKMTPTSELLLSHPPEPMEVLIVNETSGCFGESVLTGMRRPQTYVACQRCNALMLAQAELLALFEEKPHVAHAVLQVILLDVCKRDRLRNLMKKFLLGSLRPGSEIWAAVFVQLAYASYRQRKAAKVSPFAKYLSADGGSGLDGLLQWTGVANAPAAAATPPPLPPPPPPLSSLGGGGEFGSVRVLEQRLDALAEEQRILNMLMSQMDGKLDMLTVMRTE